MQIAWSFYFPLDLFTCFLTATKVTLFSPNTLTEKCLTDTCATKYLLQMSTEYVSNNIKLVHIKLTYFTVLQNTFIYNWISTADYTGQQILNFFLSHELLEISLALLFMLNSDMYTEVFYQAGFQRYGAI